MEYSSERFGTVKSQIPRSTVEISNVESAILVEDVLGTLVLVLHVDRVVGRPRVEQNHKLLLQGKAEWLTIFILTFHLQCVHCDRCFGWNVDL